LPARLRDRLTVVAIGVTLKIAFLTAAITIFPAI
jgi:hypothetical protein